MPIILRDRSLGNFNPRKQEMAITASTHSVGLLYPHLFTKVFLGPDLGDVEHTVPRLFCITLNGLPELQWHV